MIETSLSFMLVLFLYSLNKKLIQMWHCLMLGKITKECLRIRVVQCLMKLLPKFEHVWTSILNQETFFDLDVVLFKLFEKKRAFILRHLLMHPRYEFFPCLLLMLALNEDHKTLVTSNVISARSMVMLLLITWMKISITTIRKKKWYIRFNGIVGSSILEFWQIRP